jgi:hypothetical protein
MTVDFQPVLVESIVRDDESHVVGTVAHRITSPRLGWAEQSVVLLEMEAQTSKRINKLVIFAWSSNFSRYSSNCIIQANESHVVGTVLHRIVSARLGWAEQQRCPGDGSSNVQTYNKLVIFAWSSNFSRYSSN